MSKDKELNEVLEKYVLLGYTKKTIIEMVKIKIDNIIKNLVKDKSSSDSSIKKKVVNKKKVVDYSDSEPVKEKKVVDYSESDSDSDKRKEKNKVNSSDSDLEPDKRKNVVNSSDSDSDNETQRKVLASKNKKVVESSSDSFVTKTPVKKSHSEFYKTKSYKEEDTKYDKEYGNFFNDKDIRTGKVIHIKRDTESVKVRSPIQVNKINIKEDIMLNETYKILSERELRLNIKDVIEKQLSVNERMFEILINWLMTSHKKFKSDREVIYLTVQLIVRYLNVVKDIKREKFQLLGITCYLIADKFECVDNIDIETLIYYTANAYTESEVKKLETVILDIINFDVNMPNTFTFLSRYIIASNYDKKSSLMAFYISERILQNSKISNYLPSLVAASVIYITNLKNEFEKPWSETMRHYTRYNVEDLSECVKDINKELKIKNVNDVVYKFYSSIANLSVSKLFD